ncbi:hypothetical protein GA0061099_101926 [Bradyrhizobium yuanmingense]|uniref:Uncharacterized protein n=1 Tax=Bradyrhizobium yuanmingense TaxID=108015 RepID=A0A1C3XH15_9BRAD|nr:hypothetical protein IQ15_07167 [Bradyrhizobium yuanmingense]SCB51561.1 hypothetical protein GA0061099_101926 [Bradyrhizobium yuanmingense]
MRGRRRAGAKRMNCLCQGWHVSCCGSARVQFTECTSLLQNCFDGDKNALVVSGKYGKTKRPGTDPNDAILAAEQLRERGGATNKFLI